ncbi:MULTISPECIES: class A beta-lactamase [unclassified Nocardiopsis]|uniref:class A beta-lactamase n=1 Tax=unclassified Nocardiopsis TaxID=2649073 RepID=UPI00066C58E4|nr:MULTISPECIES: class A beta-lactamase [unclassified Nocardiopsis]MBQ1082736.1 class A beta-lactamase [Nocardiopsis sp. B62]
MGVFVGFAVRGVWWRGFVASVALVPLVGCGASEGAGDAGQPAESASVTVDFAAEFEALEQEYGSTLGVYALDTGSGDEVAFQEGERFAFASTFKALLAGVVLSENSLEEMERVVTFDEEVLVPHSPVVEEHLDSGMSLLELCDATVRFSDNAAANLLLDEIGGPAGFTERLGELTGDDVTVLERYEVEMSSAVPGEVRDTSTPEAMASSLEAFTLGDVLPEDRREVLVDLLVRNTTGDDLIRAGVPEGWVVGDKTGNGGYGTRNDIAVLWPEEGDPIVLAVMSSVGVEDAEHDDALIAEATEVVVEALG